MRAVVAQVSNQEFVRPYSILGTRDNSARTLAHPLSWSKRKQVDSLFSLYLDGNITRSGQFARYATV
jgi:hypothetical protein